MQQQQTNLEKRKIREQDSVRVHETTDWDNERETPWVGTVLGIKNGQVRVQRFDDDYRPEYADPQDIERVFGSEEEACAFLAAEGMTTYTDAWSEGKVVKAFVGEGGLNFQNFTRTFKIGPGEVGPIEQYSFERDIPEYAVCFTNMISYGLRSRDTDGWGYDSPTHKSGKHGAEMMEPEEMDDQILEAAKVAGIVQ